VATAAVDLARHGEDDLDAATHDVDRDDPRRSGGAGLCCVGVARSGEVDAAISARAPNAFLHNDGAIARLFADYRAEEARYYAETGIFPAMHVIALRRAVHERYPWAVRNLLKAFTEAKDRSLARVRDLTASRIPLPWAATLADEAAKSFGDDPFPYGIAANRKTLDAFCRFAHAQGITAARLTPEDLFPKEVQAEVRV